MPGYHYGRAPRNKGLRYPADPPTIDEIIAVMRAAADRADGHRPATAAELREFHPGDRGSSGLA